MRPRIPRSVDREGPPVAVIAPETARPMPDGEDAVDVAAHGDLEAGARPAARLLGHLQGDVVERDHVVLADRARFVLAEDGVEIDAVQGDEGARRIGGQARELVVIVRDEVLRQVGIGGRPRGDARQVQFVDEAALHGAVETLAAPAGLGE